MKDRRIEETVSKIRRYLGPPNTELTDTDIQEVILDVKDNWSVSEFELVMRSCAILSIRLGGYRKAESFIKMLN